MTQGHRINPNLGEGEPITRRELGDYWKDSNDEWNGVTPNGLWVWLKNHHVEEHDDGTISVVSGPWGSNSILASNGTGNKKWHGFIEHGVWKEC